MEVTEDHKKEIEKKILEVIIEGLEKNIISADDLPHISKFVLATIDKTTDIDELKDHLNKLSTTWPLFNHAKINEYKDTQFLDKSS